MAGFTLSSRFVEQTYRVGIRPATLLQHIKRTVDDAFGGGFLAIIHQHVHETTDHDISKLGVRENFAFTARRRLLIVLLPLLRRLAP